VARASRPWFFVERASCPWALGSRQSDPDHAAHLRTGRTFDFATARYTGSAAQIDALRSASLNGRQHSWIDGLKAVNPEAYYYWHQALSL
jgi:hypothetical protein